MITRSLLIPVAVLLFASPAFSQFAPQNRVMDLADRLSRDAQDFADSSYSNFTNNNRASRNDTEAVMLAHQFAGASQIFYRMVVDRRRPQDLRDAFYCDNDEWKGMVLGQTRVVLLQTLQGLKAA